MEPLQLDIGKKVQKLRNESGLSQEQLARTADISYATLTKIESGVIQKPSFVIIAKIAQALKLSMDDLVFDKRLSKHLIKFEASGTKVYIPKKRFSIDLSLTENPLHFSKKVLKAIEKEKEHIFHYPDPYHTDLSDALSKQFGIDAHHFIFGTGADGLIENIVRILVNPGDHVILPDLTFLNAAFAAVISGGEPVFSKMRNDFHIDFEDIKKRINKSTKMIFLCNPNNPTGLIETKESILDLVRSTSALVVVDEANIEFGGESVIRHIPKYYNLIVIRTFSKAYGLAGLRIGYCVGNEELMYYIWRVRPPFVTTYLAQKCALAALKDKKHIQQSKLYVETERNFLSQNLTNRGFKVIPSNANCFLVKVAPHFKSSTSFIALLHKHDCTVVDGKHFKGLGTDYIRIAPQLRATNKKFLQIVDLLLKKYGK